MVTVVTVKKKLGNIVYILHLYIVFEVDVTSTVTCTARAIKFTTIQFYVYNHFMTTKTPSKNGKFLGRPSKYDPVYCDQIIELGKLGKSRWQIASELGLTYSNLINWEQVHEDFREAMNTARLDALAYWEALAENHMIETPGGPRINTGLWSRSMAARFPEQYRDNSKVEVTGKNDGPIEVDHVHDFTGNLLTELLAVRQSDAESGTK